ncbi:MAG: hypothetical protein ACLFNO_03130 [Parcubacteria group bacterium]
MENERNNFEKNKYSAQIEGKQVSSLEKEKSNNKLANKIEDGLNIHSMPNSFRSGKFNDSVHPNDIKRQSTLNKMSSSPHKHKYVGVLIIVVGILILGGLGYFLYTYIMGDSRDNNTQIVQEDNDINNEENEIEDNQVDDEANLDEEEAEDTSDLEDEFVDEEDLDDITEEVDTDESATSTDPIDEDIATSTEDVVGVQDTDGDGLTNLEEHLLNTNVNLEDSDSDGYDDASEVLSLYNPAGTNELIENPGINEYSNSLHNYTILHPATWTQKVSNEGDSVMFMNENDGFFQVSVEDNDESVSIEDWYRQEFNVEEDETFNYFSEDNEMISSDDGLFVYYADEEKIYVFSYTAMTQNLGYPNIFKAFVKSFSRY